MRIDVESADFANPIRDEKGNDARSGTVIIEREKDAARVGVEGSELHELRGDVIESSTDLRVGCELGDGALIGPEQSSGDGEVLVGRGDNNRFHRRTIPAVTRRAGLRGPTNLRGPFRRCVVAPLRRCVGAPFRRCVLVGLDPNA